MQAAEIALPSPAARTALPASDVQTNAAADSYKLHGRFGKGQMATSLVLAGFEIAVDEACEG